MVTRSSAAGSAFGGAVSTACMTRPSRPVLQAPELAPSPVSELAPAPYVRELEQKGLLL